VARSRVNIDAGDAMSSNDLHEDYSRQADDTVASERNLGVTFAAVFAILAALSFYRGGGYGFVWLVIAAVFLSLAYFWTAPLRPLNLLWQRLGELLFRIVNPTIMGVVYFLTVVPIGIMRRLLGKDPLRLKLDPAAESYWQEREPPGPAGEDMKNQF
jgi:hypothetical protein